MNKTNLIVTMTGITLLLASPAWSASATAILKGTAEGSPIEGLVTFTEEKGGITVGANISHVPEGSHGFHIHAVGNCADMGNAAGGHFNPDRNPHGLYPQHSQESHAGDMGNIIADANGDARLSIFMPELTLNNGNYAINGLTIILHEKTDDFSQPTGNAGGRIGCGIIEQQ